MKSSLVNNHQVPFANLESNRKAHQRAAMYDKWFKYLILACGILMTLIIASIIIFVGKQGVKTFLEVSPLEFFTSTQWSPEEGKFGALTFIAGTFALTGLTILVGGPLGVAAAIFLAKIAPCWLSKILRPAVELFTGIPSVVYGWIGLTVIVPFIREYYGGIGFGLLAATVILTIMILPTVVSISEDAIRSLSPTLEEASYALGANRWQTISRVLVPAAAPGILTAIILGMARAIGETMAVQMVIGNTPLFPKSLSMPTSVLTTEIVMEIGNTPYNSTWNNALFLMALVLLVVSLFMIIFIRMTTGRRAG